jgi:hypothetical protein
MDLHFLSFFIPVFLTSILYLAHVHENRTPGVQPLARRYTTEISRKMQRTLNYVCAKCHDCSPTACGCLK